MTLLPVPIEFGSVWHQTGELIIPDKLAVLLKECLLMIILLQGVFHL